MSARDNRNVGLYVFHDVVNYVIIAKQLYILDVNVGAGTGSKVDIRVEPNGIE